MIQALKGTLMIPGKQIGSQIERRKNYKEPECKIPP
jgi:hypothetical protein